MVKPRLVAPSFSEKFHFIIMATYLFVKLDKGWLKKLLNILLGFIHVVWVLDVTQALVHGALLWQEVSFDLPGQSMQRHNYVLSIADLLELDV